MSKAKPSQQLCRSHPELAHPLLETISKQEKRLFSVFVTTCSFMKTFFLKKLAVIVSGIERKTHTGWMKLEANCSSAWFSESMCTSGDVLKELRFCFVLVLVVFSYWLIFVSVFALFNVSVYWAGVAMVKYWCFLLEVWGWTVVLSFGLCWACGRSVKLLTSVLQSLLILSCPSWLLS